MKILLRACLQICLIIGFLSITPTTAFSSCTGQVDEIPQWLSPSENKELLDSALGEPGEGKLCQGRVYTARKSVVVYRVWDKSKPYTAYGRWWSFERPVGDRATYRKDNDICPKWSALDIVHSCWIKPGTQIVVGPGQSAKCANSTLPQSATNQVFIPNDTQNDIKLVENCSKPMIWPKKVAQYPE